MRRIRSASMAVGVSGANAAGFCHTNAAIPATEGMTQWRVKNLGCCPLAILLLSETVLTSEIIQLRDLGKLISEVKLNVKLRLFSVPVPSEENGSGLKD
jgi:hypothetical protein